MKTRKAAAVLCLAIAGCGGGAGGSPRAISGPAKQVADVLQRFQKAAAGQDFTTICDRLLASSTRREAGGNQCPDVLGQRARGVRRPRMRIRSIEIRGNEAFVQVRTTATGQAPTNDVIRLVREGPGYRVLSLGR